MVLFQNQWGFGAAIPAEGSMVLGPYMGWWDLTYEAHQSAGKHLS
jgi:hypothetical protein